MTLKEAHELQRREVISLRAKAKMQHQNVYDIAIAAFCK